MGAAERIGIEPVQKPGKSKQDYGTPWDFIGAVEGRFGPIVFDLAAQADNAKAKGFWTIADDSLSKRWADIFTGGGTLWLNPPFKNIEPWAEKCARESARRAGLIVMLTPASIGTDWFARHVHRKAMVLGLSPRITFVGEKDPYPKDLMLSVFGMGLNGFDTWRWDLPNGPAAKDQP